MILTDPLQQGNSNNQYTRIYCSWSLDLTLANLNFKMDHSFRRDLGCIIH